MADHRNELCNPMTNWPITLWVVGHVASTWFLKDGFPEKQASLTVIPLSHALGRQTVRVMAGLSVPQLGFTLCIYNLAFFSTFTAAVTNSVYGVRAIKWQGRKNDNTMVHFMMFGSPSCTFVD